MKNDKPSPALSLSPPLDLTQINHGQPMPKYVDVMLLQAVTCQNCGMVLAPSGLCYAIDKPQLDTTGEQMHANGTREKAVLCATPKLIIMYANARLQAELIQ